MTLENKLTLSWLSLDQESGFLGTCERHSPSDYVGDAAGGDEYDDDDNDGDDDEEEDEEEDEAR